MMKNKEALLPIADAPILHCEHLKKSYGKKTVLEDFSLTLPKGRIIGLLGPNGCGKTTFLKLVSGLLVPNGGSIEICGHPRSELTNSMISFLPERSYFSSSLRVCELLEQFSDFFTDFDAAMAEEMLRDLNISPDSQLKTLSKGMKEKTQLAVVMSRRTKLYMLDEPIGGVDPASREYILGKIIGGYNKDASVIITTHLISDIEPILDEFAFMTYGGGIVRRGVADEAREEYGMSLDEQFREVFRC